ncbi:DUF3422 family protein [Methanothermococcus thermolithotrophicus]|uniref:DUF3422 family protein n=1 Tax=Methanothermococcus thermolithotrophicus TaxID=2186 RepID=UPI000377C431|nr:DUF3422 family protein [Methanothermococcus thermolithotrophicus]
MEEILKLYIKSECPLCVILKEVLEHNGVKFQLINVDELTEKEREGLTRELGSDQIAFPLIIYKGKKIFGYDKNKLEKLLGKTLDESIEAKLNDKILEMKNNKKLQEYYKIVKNFSEYQGYYLNPDKDYCLRVLDAQLKNEKNGFKYCPCKLGDILCPCNERDKEIELYGHCFCGLYVSKDYVKKWKPGETLSMLSNRSIQDYMEVPIDIKDNFVKVHLFFDNVMKKTFLDEGTPQSGEKITKFDIKELLDEYYILKNSGYGFKDNILIKFKEDVVHKNLQMWFKNLEEYLNNNIDIPSDHDFDICINTSIEIPAKREIEFKGLKISTNYNNPLYRRRYLISGENKIINNEIIKIVEYIIMLEVLSNLVEIMKKCHLKYSEEMYKIQDEIKVVLNKINISGNESFEKWLYLLVNNLSKISNLQGELSKKYNTFEYYVAQNIEKSEDFKMFLGEVDPNLDVNKILEEFYHLLTELSTLKNTVNDLVEVLETKVNISQNNKTIKLQGEIHKTTKTQLGMQKAIEGLYMIFAAFYFTELALIIFEGLHNRHIINEDPYFLAAAFIPFAMILGVVISKRLKKGEEEYDDED